MNNMINPENKCGYESVWIGLKCKHSPLIEKYYLTNMIDLYTLLRNGNDEYPSLFQDKNVKRFYNSYPQHIKDSLIKFKDRLENTENGKVPFIYYPLVSIYFKIELIILDENKQCITAFNWIKDLLNFLELEPTERIKLCLTTNHVEYIPENCEKMIFDKLKQKICNLQKIYNENNYYNKLIEELIVMSCIM